jgi:uncharacterized protein
MGLIVNFLVGIGAALFLAVLLIRLLENRFIYFPPRYPEGFSPPERYGLCVEDVWLTTEDRVRLNAWFLPNPSSPKVLLWFHGNAENIGYDLSLLEVYSRLGIGVFAPDYRGYGRSEGSPDEAGIYRDATAAYDYLVGERGVQPEDILVFGHSLGGAVAVDLAARRRCGALIVQNSFTTARDMARRVFRIPGFEYVIKSRFDSLRKIAQVQAPILIVHGTRDEVVPFFMGRRLFEAALEAKLFLAVEGAGHNDILEVGGQSYLEHLRAFIEATASGAVRGRGMLTSRV